MSAGERDRFSHHLMDLIGMGTKRLENRLAVRDDSLLFYSGLLSMHTRSAAALQRILCGLFRDPGGDGAVCGRMAWACEESDLCRFDRGLGSIGAVGRRGAIVGDEIWNQQSGVRMKLGPLRLDAVSGLSAVGNGARAAANRWRSSCRAGRSISKFN